MRVCECGGCFICRSVSGAYRWLWSLFYIHMRQAAEWTGHIFLKALSPRMWILFPAANDFDIIGPDSGVSGHITLSTIAYS